MSNHVYIKDILRYFLLHNVFYYMIDPMNFQIFKDTYAIVYWTKVVWVSSLQVLELLGHFFQSLILVTFNATAFLETNPFFHIWRRLKVYFILLLKYIFLKI